MKRHRKNRRRNKCMSVTAVRTLNVGGIILMLFAMVVFNVLAKTNEQAIQKNIGEKTRTLNTLEEDRLREETRWEGMKNSGSLQAALLNHGLKMDTPNDLQIVRMGQNRLPLKGQLSVKRAQSSRTRNMVRR